MKTRTNPSNFPTAAPRPRKGFTLVELLVSVMILVTLAALVMVIVGKVKTKAYQANAMSALRQVAAAGAAYSTEYNGNINTLRWKGDKFEGGGGKWVSNSFWGRLQPYILGDTGAGNDNQLKRELKPRIDQLFNSSDADTMAGTLFSGARVYHDDSGLAIPVAFNRNLYDYGQPFVKTTSVSDPSRVLYAVYGHGFFIEAHGSTYVEMPNDGSMPNNKIYYLEDRTALASFLDGHVDTIRPPIAEHYFR